MTATSPMNPTTLLLLTFVIAIQEETADASNGNPAQAIESVLNAHHQRGHVVGAQWAVGDGERILAEGVIGSVDVTADARAVDADTLFFAGMVSQPFAAACVLAMIDGEKVSLSSTVDEKVSACKDLGLAAGVRAVRAPTLAELLDHRGGFFGRHEHPTNQQRSLMEDRELALDEAVTAIARLPLANPPGTRFSVSIAGYDVLGRFFEVARLSTFDRLFDRELAVPLGLARTSYRPSADDGNVANGGVFAGHDVVPNPAALHLTRLRRTFVGNGIHTTARDAARLARLMLGHGVIDGRTIIPKALLDEHFAGEVESTFHAGWFVNATGTVWKHADGFGPGGAVIRVDRDRGRFAAVLWIARPTEDRAADGTVTKEIEAAAVRTIQRLAR